MIFVAKLVGNLSTFVNSFQSLSNIAALFLPPHFSWQKLINNEFKASPSWKVGPVAFIKIKG